MSTDFSDIWDDIIARLATLYPNHSRLPDAYNLEANSTNLLRQGIGVSIEPTVANTLRFSSNIRSISVPIVVSFTRRYMATDSNVDGRIQADLDLIADFQTLIDDIWKNDLGIDQTLNYALSEVLTADGTTAVILEKDNFRALRCNLTVEYFRRD